MALAARADRRAAAVEPPYAVEGVLPAHRLVQARRRPQGHDGQGRHAGHAQGLPDRPAGAAGTAEPAPGRSSSGRTPKRPLFPAPTTPRRGPSARPAPRRCAAPGRASSGTSSSPATTISDTRPWSAPRCATPSTTATAGRSPCSASPPPRGSSPRATTSSDGTRQLREKNLLSMAIENCALLAIENCAVSTWCRTPRFGVEVVGLGGAVGNRVGAATIKSLARQPGYP